jgi:hypothetical protein
MADDEKDEDGGDEPWGEGPEVPPLIDTENPLAGDEDGDADDDESRDWVPPVP